MTDVREALQRICSTDERWDGRVCVAQVTDTSESTVQVRLLVSARNSGELFDLRCAVRERMVDYLNQAHPEALPRLRMDLQREAAATRGDASRQHPIDALRDPGPDTHARTHSPGAEEVNQADEAALRAQAAREDAAR